MQTIFTPYKGIVVITILVLAEIMQSLPSDNSVRNITIRFLKIDSNNTSYSSICQTANLVIKLIFSTVSKYIIQIIALFNPHPRNIPRGKWMGEVVGCLVILRTHDPLTHSTERKSLMIFFFFSCIGFWRYVIGYTI